MDLLNFSAQMAYHTTIYTLHNGTLYIAPGLTAKPYLIF